MRLKPSCSWCKQHDQFVENPQLKIVVQCFKTLCQYLASPAVSASLARSKSSNGCTNNLMAIIQEGVSLGQPTDSARQTQTVTVFPASLQRVNKLRLKRQRRQRGGYKRYSRLMFGRATKVAATQNDVPVISDESSQQEQLATSAATETTACCENGRSVNSDSGIDAPITASSHVAPPCKHLQSHNTASEAVIPAPLATSVAKQRKPLHKTTGCRCGLATRTPGSLTCCGQRCPCYSSFKGCSDCICRGCRNPRGDLKPGVPETFVSAANNSDTDPMIVVDV